MLKYAIKSKDSNKDILIFHALPDEMTKFQWYISENICEQGDPIDGQIYESYTLSIEMVKYMNYDGKYICCMYLETESKYNQHTEYIQLGLSIDSMVQSGVNFDNISRFNEQGEIVEIN